MIKPAADQVDHRGVDQQVAWRLIVGIAATLIVAALASRKVSAARRRAVQLAAIAPTLGLAHTRTDHVGCERLPFSFFDHLREPRAENVMLGNAGTAAVRIFDVRWVVARDADGTSERSRTFMAADLGGVFPHLCVRPQGMLDTLVEHVSSHDLQFEWEEFNDAFIVTCDDERFARTLLDARMMEFIYKVGRGSTIELRGRWLLLDPGRLLPPDDWRLLHIFALEFPSRIPSAVWSHYPGPGADPHREAPPPPVALLAPRHEYTGEFNWVTGRDDRPELPRLGREPSQEAS